MTLSLWENWLEFCRSELNPKKIVFSGVGKTEEEIRVALSAGVGVFNIESEPEFERLAKIAAQMHCRPRVYFRVNPDVDAHTHPYISTD